MLIPAQSPEHASLLAFPPTGRLPSTLSAADLWSVLFEASQVLHSRPAPHTFLDSSISSTWGGRPTRAKTYGKKREHGLNSFGAHAVDELRLPAGHSMQELDMPPYLAKAFLDGKFSEVFQKYTLSERRLERK